MADLDSGRTRQLTDDAAAEATPVWSPDSRSIVFQTFRSGGAELYIVNADGSGLRKLTAAAGEQSSPAFSPDGSKLAYVTLLNRKESQINVLDLASGKVALVGSEPAVGREEAPQWSPDGRSLAYIVIKDNAVNVHAMRADGSQKLALTEGKDLNSQPQWSPDGKRIAYLSVHKPNPRQAVYTMNADGSDKREALGGEAEHFIARWAPDGSGFYFVSFHRGAGQIFRAGADGSAVQQLSPGQGYDAELVVGRQVKALQTARAQQ